MLCSLKIAVCDPKITIISKNCRLKITDISKNYRLKIPVRARIYARMYARMYGNSHQDTGPEHRTPGDERKPPEKGGPRKKPAYIGIFVATEKSIKKLRKIWKYKKTAVSLLP